MTKREFKCVILLELFTCFSVCLFVCLFCFVLFSLTVVDRGEEIQLTFGPNRTTRSTEELLKDWHILILISFARRDARLRHPFTCVIAGPTPSGKTRFTKHLILADGNKLIEPPIENIIWCYGEYQDAYDHLASLVPQIRFFDCYPDDLLQSLDRRQRTLVVIDDLMSESGNNTKVTELFTKGSHHRNLSVILILQNLFYKGREMRTISLNAH